MRKPFEVGTEIIHVYEAWLKIHHAYYDTPGYDDNDVTMVMDFLDSALQNYLNKNNG